MSKKLYEESNIEDIANAIREQNGTQNTYKVSQMPAAVRAIKTQPVLQEKTATENGNVVADAGYDGLSRVSVQVPSSESSGLPSEYQEVEYLEVDGNGVHAIIDYTLQNEDTLKIHIVHTTYNTSNAAWGITTSYGSGSGLRFNAKFTGTTSLNIFAGTGGQIYEVTRPGAVVANENNLELYGFSQSEPLVCCLLVSSSIAMKLVIGSYSSSNSQWPTAGSKIYGPVTIRRANGNYCVFAVPCYRKADNVCGYYDLCSEAFYAQTGGTFTPGPNETNNYDFQNVSILKPRTIEYIGTFEPYKGTDGYSRIIIPQEITEQRDIALLFHFDDDFYNIGTTVSEAVNTTGLEISSEQSKFGSKSLKSGNTNTGNNIALTNFDFGNKDFTIDFWFYAIALQSDTGSCVVSGSYRSIGIWIRSKAVNLAIAKTSSSWNIDHIYTVTNDLSKAWHHVAVVRQGINIFTFLDGVKLATENYATNIIAPISHLNLGYSGLNGSTVRFQGYIDELRVVLGKAIWTEDFTPPTEPYTVKYKNLENLEF